MNMRKLTAGLVLGSAVAGMVAGAAYAESSDKISINVIAAQYGQQTANWWKGFEKDFEKDNPNIDLNVDVVSWNDIYTAVNTRIANNQAPDILNINVFADYQADGLLLPAKDYVSEETYSKMYESFLDQSVVDGTVWAIPDLASARAMYYNADILKEVGVEAPKTWDDLKNVCKAIKDHYKGEVYPWGIDLTTDEGQAAFAYYTWNNGGGFVDDDNNWALNSEKNVEAVEFEIGLIKDGYTNTDPANETRYDLQDMFGAGKIAMMIGPNSIPAYLKEGGYSIHYEVAPIPTNTDTSVSAGVMDRFMCFDNGYSDEKLKAISTFFDYFYDDQRYSDWVQIMAAWVDIVGSSKFYPTAKAEWADVKQGVIDVEQNALLGEDVKGLLDGLQSEIAG